MTVGHSKDRAGIVTRAVLQVVARNLHAWADGDPDADIAAVYDEIATLLRDEFRENSRETRDEIRLVD
jgi:hypothetical protein